MLMFSMMRRFAQKRKADFLEISMRGFCKLALAFGRISLGCAQLILNRHHDVPQSFSAVRADFAQLYHRACQQQFQNSDFSGQYGNLSHLPGLRLLRGESIS